MRKRIGYRVWEVRFERHNGGRNEYGTPTYDVPGDWYDPLNGSFIFAELLNTEGGETIRGRQVTERTSHVVYTDWDGVKDIKSTDRAVISGNRYEIIAIDDPEGMLTEARIQLRREG